MLNMSLRSSLRLSVVALTAAAALTGCAGSSDTDSSALLRAETVDPTSSAPESAPQSTEQTTAPAPAVSIAPATTTAPVPAAPAQAGVAGSATRSASKPGTSARTVATTHPAAARAVDFDDATLQGAERTYAFSDGFGAEGEELSYKLGPVSYGQLVGNDEPEALVQVLNLALIGEQSESWSMFLVVGSRAGKPVVLAEHMTEPQFTSDFFTFRQAATVSSGSPVVKIGGCQDAGVAYTDTFALTPSNGPGTLTHTLTAQGNRTTRPLADC